MSGWIKICGIRDLATAEEAAKLGVSAIGLNFFEKSPRCVSLADGVNISRHCQANVSVSSRLGVSTSLPLPVGLFVNHGRNQLEAITTAADITTIQLHGDEPPEFL